MSGLAFCLQDCYITLDIQHCSTARLWVCWSLKIIVTVLEESSQRIRCRASHLSNTFIITICYCDNSIQPRQELCDSLSTCAASISSLNSRDSHR
ncbi:hypothetical protein AAC387_Pa11g0354 [Persea americana]